MIPAEIAVKAEQTGVAKIATPPVQLFVLAVLAGAFIALGAMFSITAAVDGGGRLLIGLAFSLGLILVVLAGAELFTGNNLIIMAWASGKVGTLQLLKHWTIVYIGNFAGAAATAVMMTLTGQQHFRATAITIAQNKTSLEFGHAVMLGVMCNILVCLAVWLCLGADSTIGKIASIIPPITAFVAAGFEHSVANMYFFPLGMLLQTDGRITWTACLFGNLLPVTIGNLIGGAGLVGGVYWFVYLRDAQRT